MRKKKCTFAPPGTNGHECGRVAVTVGLSKSVLTKSGIFYSYRCKECASISGGENTKIFYWEDYDPAKHINFWK